MTDVTVLGGGIIGMTAAIRLQQRGARVTVVCAAGTLETVSAVAAAVWYPTHTDPEPRVRRWVERSYAEFLGQAEAGVPGVLLRRTRMLVRADPPWWAPPGTTTTAHDLRFTAPLTEMDRYLPWLHDRIVASGGRFVRRRVEDPAELLDRSAAVVNATGLAAPDPDLYPVRGQLVLVTNPGLDESIRDEDNPAGITYVHPRRRDTVLGGTFEPDRTDLEPDPRQRAAIIDRCTALVPELRGARVLGDRVGLRPARRGGPRVEAVDGPDGRIVHAYGHGGAGMTMSWGCADEVADLVLG
ncbi:FAD-dependent oxidoreductase [Actinoplanes oblitus]|uniref:D-amino-acid oxidase n=1 Tax=Actinoplanes oblitus TaxID=3040509 RepID=A0ABY8WDI6_9ACTN|nr:FAD-dependent oxidoreductase [Actinoplanes oblitus]WIM94992.1 FAD-dependent oxidoreductase [Actinoplanes oblitus]